MAFSSNPADIALAAGRDGDEAYIWEAAMRLKQDRNDDVRTIGAQAIVNNSYADRSEIEIWLSNENSSEVRGWLILAIATTSGSSSLNFINNKLRELEDSIGKAENLFFDAALAIASNSRYYLLKIMMGLYDEDSEVSRIAADLCRMLISQDAKEELRFLDILEGECRRLC